MKKSISEEINTVDKTNKTPHGHQENTTVPQVTESEVRWQVLVDKQKE